MKTNSSTSALSLLVVVLLVSLLSSCDLSEESHFKRTFSTLPGAQPELYEGTALAELAVAIHTHDSANFERQLATIATSDLNSIGSSLSGSRILQFALFNENPLAFSRLLQSGASPYFGIDRNTSTVSYALRWRVDWAMDTLLSFGLDWERKLEFPNSDSTDSKTVLYEVINQAEDHTIRKCLDFNMPIPRYMTYEQHTESVLFRGFLRESHTVIDEILTIDACVKSERVDSIFDCSSAQMVLQRMLDRAVYPNRIKSIFRMFNKLKTLQGCSTFEEHELWLGEIDLTDYTYFELDSMLRNTPLERLVN